LNSALSEVAPEREGQLLLSPSITESEDSVTIQSELAIETDFVFSEFGIDISSLVFADDILTERPTEIATLVPDVATVPPGTDVTEDVSTSTPTDPVATVDVATSTPTDQIFLTGAPSDIATEDPDETMVSTSAPSSPFFYAEPEPEPEPPVRRDRQLGGEHRRLATQRRLESSLASFKERLLVDGVSSERILGPSKSSRHPIIGGPTNHKMENPVRRRMQEDESSNSEDYFILYGGNMEVTLCCWRGWKRGGGNMPHNIMLLLYSGCTRAHIAVPHMSPRGIVRSI